MLRQRIERRTLSASSKPPLASAAPSAPAAPSVPAAPAAPAAVPTLKPQAAGLLRWPTNAVSSGLVVAVLGGIAYWGHRTHWTVPKFSMLVGSGAVEADDWCKEHNVPESECIECDVALLAPETDYGWCKEHGVAQCPLHHPEVAQLKQIPAVSPESLERATLALELVPRPENNSRCELHQRRIQFASAEALEKAGIDIDVAAQRPIVEAIAAYGEVVYDETRTAHLASRVAGTVWRVDTQIGDRVNEGDVLALVDSAFVGRAKGEFLQAIAHLRHEFKIVERLKPLAAERSIAGKQFHEAEATLEDARIGLLSAEQALNNLGLAVHADDFVDLSTEEIAEHLRYLGLPGAVAGRLDGKSTTSNLYPLRSPHAGVIVERNLVAGEVVDTSTRLFSVSDLSRMWLVLHVRQEDAGYLSLGQTVLFRSGDRADEAAIRGRLAWISTSADDRTRTVKVRVDLPNVDGRLRANTFGNGRIVLREEPRAVVVPSEALHWDGCCHVVFVRDKHYLEPGAPKFFHIRKVRPGVVQSNTTEIIVGLLPGEVIAAKNSVVLEAQLLKSNLGAGCGCCAPGH